ncbi:MAG: patatin-like phospholipase family protein [Anaerolineales bacterium]
MSKKRVALVIGSGGIKCAAAIGMWKVLQNEIPVDLIVGCSGGSIYSAVISRGGSVEYMAESSKEIWTTDIMQGYTTNLRATRDGSLKFNERSGLVDDSFLNKALEKVAFDLSFDDVEIPLKIIATDMLTGEKIILSEGKIQDAVRASLAIPLIFPPWEIDGRLLIDGGVSDPLPIDVAIQEGADIIIAMGFSLSYRNRFRSMTAVQEQLNSIYMNNILKATYAFYNLAHHAEIFPIIPDFDEPLSMFDVNKIPEIITRGEEATKDQLPHIKRLLDAL